jgi:DHA1 family bicyclomycin/chloramphenicol resistance-like MFS transporter
MFTGAVSSAIVAFFYDGRSAHAMTATMFSYMLVAFLIYLFVVRPAEQRSG